MLSETEKKASADACVPVLERALLLMEYLLRHPEGLGVSELSHQLDIPKNTVYRIVNTLLKHGYLKRDPETKRFALTRKMLSMGYSGAMERGLMENALESMRALRDTMRETVLLTVLSEDKSLVLEQMPGIYPFRFVVEPGTQRAIHASSHGKAVLAFLSTEEQETFLARAPYPRYTENTITSARRMRQELAKIHACGYAFDLAEEADGVRCVSAAIFNRFGAPVAALTTTGPAFRMPEQGLEEIGSCVKQHADAVSRRLGYGLFER